MPAARHTDPQTSHEAAASVNNVTETQQVILRVFREFGPMCDASLVARLRLLAPLLASESGIRSRRAELTRLGLIEDSGELVKLSSGRRAIVWKAA
jgi:hypothetical protein